MSRTQIIKAPGHPEEGLATDGPQMNHRQATGEHVVRSPGEGHWGSPRARIVSAFSWRTENHLLPAGSPGSRNI